MHAKFRLSSRCLFLALLAPTSLSLAISDISTRDFTTWSPPGPDDVRSPCPGLNALANHGFLPHNGKDLTLNDIISALGDGMNIDPTVATFFFAGALLTSPNPLGGSFDLDNLDASHNYLEHDGSLSRQDLYFGNNTVFNQTFFDNFFAFYDGMTNTSIPVASHTKYSRVNDSLTRDPSAIYGPTQFLLSYGESTLYLSVLGDPVTGSAPVGWVKIFFEEERLPYEEGWQLPQTIITFPSINAMILELFASSGETLPEGLDVISVGKYQDALANMDALEKALGSQLCPITKLC